MVRLGREKGKASFFVQRHSQKKAIQRVKIRYNHMHSNLSSTLKEKNRNSKSAVLKKNNKTDKTRVKMMR